MDAFATALITILALWLVLNALFRLSKKFAGSSSLELKYGVILSLRKKSALETSRVFKKLGYVFIGLFAISLALFLYFSVNTVVSRVVSNAPGAVLLIPGVNIKGLDILYFVIALSIAVITHEYFHAKTAVSNDVEVKSFGFMVTFIIPLAFVEVSEERFNLSPLKAKTSILAAGVAVNFIIGLAFLAILLLSSTPALHVIGVEQGGLADSLGVSTGDILLAVNGTRLTDFESLKSILSSSNEGVLVLEVLKPNGEVEVKQFYKNSSPVKLGVNLTETRVPAEGLARLLGYSSSTGLLKAFSWIYLVNFNLALINAAPIFITDGGRIVYEVLGDKLGLLVNSMCTVMLVLMIAPIPF
uniref:PDZ domain-containing protein n=1 Tax=Thermosphaera aggregans TaxID=54254 RepID=A0A7C2FDQ3_9CREN